MKIRTGFVSNSSSSSFLFMTSLENHNKVMEELNDYEKSIMKEVIRSGKLFGKEVVYVGDLCVQDYSFVFEDLPKEESELYPDQIFGKYARKVKAISNKDEVFHWAIS